MAPRYLLRDFPDIEPDRLERLHASRAATSAAVAAALVVNIALIAAVAAGIFLDDVRLPAEQVAASIR